MHVAVVDIGKPGRNLGWAIIGPEAADGDDLDVFVDKVAALSKAGSVAIGFEAPMYVPQRVDQELLLSARKGECDFGVSRPFSAAAGATALVTGLVIVPYVLNKLRSMLPNAVGTMDWKSFMPVPNSILFFEAFVTNQNALGQGRHVGDAKLAASEFYRSTGKDLTPPSAIVEPKCFSLLGAAMLRCGWSNDLALLSQECLVVRATR